MEELSNILCGGSGDDEIYALLEDSKSDDKDSRNLLFTDAQELIIAWSEEELSSAIEKIEELKSEGLYLCGYLSYEAGFHFIDKAIKKRLPDHPTQPLLYFVAFKKMESISRENLDKSFAEIDTYPEAELCPHNFSMSVAKDTYLEAIRKIRRYIIAGDTYQINYTIKYKFDLLGNAISLYKALRKTQPVEFGAVLNFPNSNIVSLSPELFVKKKDGMLYAKPMKGTAKRGRNTKEDEFILDFLQNDPKTLSENVMIVDLIRNDFGRICETGSVSVKNLFEIQTFKTIHQMISTIKGKLKPEIHLSELLHGLFPCGSITGAPKVRTMEIINELEAEPRGVYTGAIGYLLPNDDFYFNVPIRTIDIGKDNRCEMGIGSGIIYESNPQAEYEECLLKANFLTGINNKFYLIETMKFDGEKQDYKNLRKHLERLNYSASYFGFVLKQRAMQEKLSDLKTMLSSENKSYKVRLTAFHSGDIELTHELLSEDDGKIKTIMISNRKINSKSIFQYHKTSRREIYNEEYEKAVEQGHYEAIIFNEHNEIAEACRHNIFVKRQGKWYTPPLSAGILDGIERQNFKQKTEAVEKFLTLDQLQHCEEIVLTNSVRGEVRVILEKDKPVTKGLGESAHSINLDEYVALSKKEDVVILDVRLQRDYEDSEYTLPNSTWKDPLLVDKWVDSISKNQKTIVYCVHGRSISENITERLLSEGIDACFIESGIEGIRELGVEVDRSNAWF
jgi:para-aminobenzoate synthetase/4-amino-4-deoxychorismate lyase